MLFFFSSPKMLKMVFFVAFFCTSFLADAGEERVRMLNLLSNPSHLVLQSFSHTGTPVAVSLDNQFLVETSSSVLMAESWLRTHVLTHYPALQITTIVVGNNILCNNSHEAKWDLVLPSMTNIYHSLMRWGLEKDIKVSAALSTQCLHPYSEDLVDRLIKPLLNFLQITNSSFSVNALLDFSSHKEFVKKLGYFNVNVVRVKVHSRSRKLSSFLTSNGVDPFPVRPTPLPEIPSPPIHSSIGLSVPANIAKSPLPPLTQAPSPPSLTFPFSPQTPPFPPLAQTSQPPSMIFPFAPQATPSPLQPSSPPSMSFSFPPQSPPLVIPSNPPDVLPYPPCSATPTPSAGVGEDGKGSWCVAKPSVPEEKLKEAMDYACGAGGADCEEITPHGSCYYPDTMVAHASYAFNSYWQKNKKIGGTCNFGETAMVINTNPSFEHCRFILS